MSLPVSITLAVCACLLLALRVLLDVALIKTFGEKACEPMQAPTAWKNAYFDWLYDFAQRCISAWRRFLLGVVKDSVNHSSEDKISPFERADAQSLETLGYEFIGAIGAGAFNPISMVKNAKDQFLALKKITRNQVAPRRYESQLRNTLRYASICNEHPTLLRIETVVESKEGESFFYLMELADSQSAGWEKNPERYRPRTLEFIRREATSGILSVADSLRFGMQLAESLDFLNRKGLTHLNIKTSNILFVNGRAKLGSIDNLVDMSEAEEKRLIIGTLGYMPPEMEPWTPQASIYSLGKVMYTISTGLDVKQFPELPDTDIDYRQYRRLNEIIIKACDPDHRQRYQTARQLLNELQSASNSLGADNEPNP